MKTDENSLKLLKILKVERTKGKGPAKELRLKVSVTSIFENLSFADPSSKDVANLKTIEKAETANSGVKKSSLNILRLNVNLIPKGDFIVAEKPETIKGEISIKRSEDFQFEFDDDNNSILVIEAKIIGIRPDGTKRKVVTYEDTDEIDETIG